MIVYRYLLLPQYESCWASSCLIFSDQWKALTCKKRETSRRNEYGDWLQRE